jgi:hypothetical protein
MNIQEISQLTPETLDRLTSDQYRAAFDDPTTGKEFVAKVNALEKAPRPRRGAGSTRSAEAIIEQAPATSGFDPSFDESPEAAARAAAPAQPVAEVQPAAAAEPKPATELSIWRYQPQDAQGRNIGGEQVFRYDPTLPVDDPKSLASQLTKAHKSATIALRTRKAQEIIESAEKVATAYQEPKFLDPKDNPNAEQINQLTANAIKNATLSALNLFQQNNPAYVRSNENAAALINWVGKSGRDPGDAATWELAWTALKPYLEVEQPAAPVQAPVPAAPIAEQPKAAAAAVPAPVRAAAVGISTGLSNADILHTDYAQPTSPTTSGVRITLDGKSQVINLKTWESWSSDVQKRVLRGSAGNANSKAIDLLYEQDQQARAARRGR